MVLAYINQITEAFPATLPSLALTSKSLHRFTTPYIHRKMHINFDPADRIPVKEKLRKLLNFEVALKNIRELSFSSANRYSNDCRQGAEHLETAVHLIKRVDNLSSLR